MHHREPKAPADEHGRPAGGAAAFTPYGVMGAQGPDVILATLKQVWHGTHLALRRMIGADTDVICGPEGCVTASF